MISMHDVASQYVKGHRGGQTRRRRGGKWRLSDSSSCSLCCVVLSSRSSKRRSMSSQQDRDVSLRFPSGSLPQDQVSSRQPDRTVQCVDRWSAGEGGVERDGARDGEHDCLNTRAHSECSNEGGCSAGISLHAMCCALRLCLLRWSTPKRCCFPRSPRCPPRKPLRSPRSRSSRPTSINRPCKGARGIDIDEKPSAIAVHSSLRDPLFRARYSRSQ